MEFEVRVVTGIETCFVSFPLSLIHTLQSTVRGGLLPPLLALELRSLSGDQTWNVAWSGSSSKSKSIEVAQQLAECISLSDHTQVQIKVISQLPKAIAVSVEPCTEDDWEILELNSELAEDSILKQVGIVYEGMKFPLWLHSHVVVMFLVQSVSPKQAVAQLVPGTEVIVAPKMRRKITTSYGDVSEHISQNGKCQKRALLRVQEDSKKVVHKMECQGVELGVVLTTAVFIHPETARNLSFNNLQLINILPRSSQDESKHKSSSINTITYLLLSDSVARGHVMIPQTLGLLLCAEVHSWVYLKKIDRFVKNNISKITITPCQFKLKVRTEAYADLMKQKTIHSSSIFDLSSASGMPDWSLHDKFLASLSHTSPNDAGIECKMSQKQCLPLIYTWLTGQLKAIATYAGNVDVDFVVLTKETLLHFEASGPKFLSGISLGKSEGSIAKIPNEILYLFSTKFEELSNVGLQVGFELSFKKETTILNELRDVNLELGKVEFGEPVSFNSAINNNLDRKYSYPISSLSWLEMASVDIIKRLTILLSASSGKLLGKYQLPFPGHVLIYGPPGCGKTSLNWAIAKYFEDHEEILAHVIFINCSMLASEKSQTIQKTITAYLHDALVHSPSLVVFDDIDKLVPSSSELDESQSFNSIDQLVGFFTHFLDEYGEKRLSTCGIGAISFLASSQSIANLPHALISPGRFDFHIELPSPGVFERTAIMNHEIKKHSLQCATDILSEVASKCDGYDAHDLEMLLNRAINIASSRYLYKENNNSILVRDDFLKAMEGFSPLSMRNLKKASSQEEQSGWGDVGGLVDICNTIREMIEMPSKFPSIFSKAPLRLRSNLLLYGPPGCGKTHIVGAAAASSSLRFISVKGPELLNKYIGASEQAVRDVFTKAASAAPCLLFFDEFDSIAPKRGHDNTGVTDRVVNQFLTELDGVESLTGVFVFAATSRPDLLDTALLRPGRLDRLLFCDFPSWHDRLDILKVLSRKLPLASDVSLATIASMTEGFSGADLQALLADSQLAAVNDVLKNNPGQSAKPPYISDVHLRSVASKARPSVSESEKQRLHAIYNQFLDSKKSVNSKSRDVKGKRATLA